LPLIYLLPSLT